jgi:predicted nucleic acid-binding protein
VIVLDTNVLSAVMRRDRDQQVVGWLNGQPAAELYTTSISVFEVRLGLELLPTGRRRRALQVAGEATRADVLGERVLRGDERTADAAAVHAATRQRAGRPVDIRDAQIAGIASAWRATLVTRNVRDFAGMGLTLVDPWAS